MHGDAGMGEETNLDQGDTLCWPSDSTQGGFP